MKVTYDSDESKFMVGKVTLREFYVTARIMSGISIKQLERDSGLTRGVLFFIEFPMANGKYSLSVKSMLVALMTLGYSVELNG